MSKKGLGTPRLHFETLYLLVAVRGTNERLFLNLCFVLMLKYFKVRTRTHVIQPEVLQYTNKLFFPQKCVFSNEVCPLCNGPFRDWIFILAMLS